MLKFSITLMLGLSVFFNARSDLLRAARTRSAATTTIATEVRQSDSKQSSFAQGKQPQGVPLKIGDLRPTLSFKMLSGAKTQTWQALEGKVVVIDFWASWCTPCLSAFPRLNELDRQFKSKGVTFISVTYEPANYVRGFLKDHPIEAEVGIDDTLDTFKNFQAWGIPVIYVFDRSGRFVSMVHPNNFTEDLLLTCLRGEIPKVKQSKLWDDPVGAEKYFRKHQLELQEKYPPVH